MSDHVVTVAVEPGYGESVTEWASRVKPRQHYHQVKGWILYLPRTQLTVVPHTLTNNGWYCTVVRGSEVYPVGGYDIYVSHREVERADRCEVSLKGWVR